MSSKFRPAQTPRQTPPWCKTAIADLASGVLSPQPSTLTGYVDWVDATETPPVDLHEQFCLTWQPTLNRYQGKAPFGVYSIELIIEKAPADHYWEIYVRLYRNGAFLDHESWHDFYIFPGGLFDSGYQKREFPPPYDHVAWQAAG